MERIKEESPGLRGSISQELASDVDHVSHATTRPLKCHGAYQQDNRGNRKARRTQGLEKDYIFMVPKRIPRGRLQ